MKNRQFLRSSVLNQALTIANPDRETKHIVLSTKRRLKPSKKYRSPLRKILMLFVNFVCKSKFKFTSSPYFRSRFFLSFRSLFSITQFHSQKNKLFVLKKNQRKPIMFRETGFFIHRNNFFVSFSRSFNNIFVYVTDRKGKVKYFASSGYFKFRGSKRVSFPAAIALARGAGQFIMREKYKHVHFLIKSPIDRMIKQAIYTVANVDRGIPFEQRIQFGYIFSVLNVAHNGVRKRKARRV